MFVKAPKADDEDIVFRRQTASAIARIANSAALAQEGRAWSGTFQTGDSKTVTVENGQIVGVA
jgi:hypothetical protein